MVLGLPLQLTGSDMKVPLNSAGNSNGSSGTALQKEVHARTPFWKATCEIWRPTLSYAVINAVFHECAISIEKRKKVSHWTFSGNLDTPRHSVPIGLLLKLSGSLAV
jgi:hypothetical protein